MKTCDKSFAWLFVAMRNLIAFRALLLYAPFQSAAQLEESDELASILLQVCGPAHINWHDPRWQELLMGYDIWVHVEQTRHPDDVVSMACASMAKHATNSSNLAALCRHVSRMMRDLQTQTKASTDITDKISLVGKARATCGSLNLLKTLVHDVPPDQLGEALLYRSRDTDRGTADHMAGAELATCLLNYLSSASSTDHQLPELYDVTVISLQLLLVLLSTQLYQPMVSSIERKHRTSSSISNNYLLDYIMEEARRREHSKHRLDSTDEMTTTWSPQSLLKTCLGWQLHRPIAPPRSIAYHSSRLIESVIAAKGDKVGPDGMYETHVIVTAEKPKAQVVGNHAHSPITNHQIVKRSSSKLLLDATKGVWVLSSSLILLPFRLMSLALALLRTRGGPEYDQLKKQHIKAATQNRRTNDVLWLTMSPIADLSTSLLLILAHNYRAGNNPFRAELAALNDDRWEEMNGMSSATQEDDEDNNQVTNLISQPQQLMTTNFEVLFESFGSILHTEIGALLLYTMYQSSPIFAASMAVRSDLDTLVVPLLRTLYFSSSSRHYSGKSASKSSSSTALALRNCPFRSLSQVYLNLILLLLLSQDASFGPDAFRRVMVTSVPWYRERNLKDITLGSLLVLTLLRSITFNLNRLQDAFILSNCCAVLMNISPHVVELHDYAAMRLATVAISILKNYSVQVARNGGQGDDGDLSTPLGMYGEVARTLLGLLRYCLSPRNIEKNLHLVYALLYQQQEFSSLIEKPTLSSLKGDLIRLDKIIKLSSKIVHEDGDARTAPRAFKALETNMEKLKAVCDSSLETDFTFSYEEEADPEVFFVPYIWEVVVCVVTASTIDWDTDRIQVFPLLDDLDEDINDSVEGDRGIMQGFTNDVADVV